MVSVIMISKLLSLTYAPRVALRNVTIAFILMGMPALAEPLTLVALGDSLTEGYGLPPDQGLVPQLQAWLAATGADVTVVNAGVSGDTTAGGASRLDWTLTPEVDAVIVTLGGNDMLRGIDPATSRANLDTILQGITARGLPFLLVAMKAPGNYGPEYKAQFDAIYPELAAKYGPLPAPQFFKALMQGATDPAAVQHLMQPDGIHPNAEGVTRIVEGLGPYVLTLLATVPQ
jgi:acyl-CoA thioesterase-1